MRAASPFTGPWLSLDISAARQNSIDLSRQRQVRIPSFNTTTNSAFGTTAGVCATTTTLVAPYWSLPASVDVRPQIPLWV